MLALAGLSTTDTTAPAGEVCAYRVAGMLPLSHHPFSGKIHGVSQTDVKAMVGVY